MKFLLHCCCGPCSVGSLPQFIEAGYQPFGYFNNPNIHPYQEHQARLFAFEQVMKVKGIPYAVEREYPLEHWLSQVAADPDNRCGYCYQSRLSQAAKFAKEHNFSAFSTTLLISPYQDHQRICDIGQNLAIDFGLDFVYLDLRKGFRDGQKEARNLGLYMQKYCGCIYSEKERYCKQTGNSSKGEEHE